MLLAAALHTPTQTEITINTDYTTSVSGNLAQSFSGSNVFSSTGATPAITGGTQLFAGASTAATVSIGGGSQTFDGSWFNGSGIAGTSSSVLSGGTQTFQNGAGLSLGYGVSTSAGPVFFGGSYAVPGGTQIFRDISGIEIQNLGTGPFGSTNASVGVFGLVIVRRRRARA